MKKTRNISIKWNDLHKTYEASIDGMIDLKMLGDDKQKAFIKVKEFIKESMDDDDEINVSLQEDDPSQEELSSYQHEKKVFM